MVGLAHPDVVFCGRRAQQGFSCVWWWLVRSPVGLHAHASGAAAGLLRGVRLQQAWIDTPLPSRPPGMVSRYFSTHCLKAYGRSSTT